ncbi:class I SAM-dependent methyltransferase [Halomonas sp. McH1-25]|uniref:class I SAM-dependent methyltransferase n=1 Tax=unclassified Halomonas TaxID=2609666 RepID=UPI001EF6CB5D|nr:MULTISPECIES: class I SAM-dependent methyltransferase [unclassified Halomonas]MCG7600374.1 class I SAM-dependent methyltransferase [Halomonas sp. McH1-25]MCP1343996.1 class I SAM-dependent methyltransferase [Halomonas sp. FL8]MCP1361500.1 class I SAM-dependent methyltransferase [Halomonas sp. BBD45]MCP1366582.1 class I SAM-dependent methyltransferase [Halomonas sp. BBD48]
MTAVTPPCQLLERQDADYRGWLWVAPPRDPWLESAQGQLWSADMGVCQAWRERGRVVFDSLSPEIGGVPGAVLFWPKAHALGEWWLLALCSCLPMGTRLQVVGENQGGIKRVLKVLAALGLGCRRVDNARRCLLLETTTAAVPLSPDEVWTTFEALGLRLVSHPGVFGHGKLDEGTRLLLDHLPSLPGAAERGVLDVGCGDGVIAASLARQGAKVAATDINVFAVEATRRTLQANGLEGRVVQGDVYSGLPDGERFAAIVSNPPFHQERDIDYGPAARLIREAPERLMTGGSLTLVANAFLPYPDLLEAAFGSFTVLADDRRFRVYHAVQR